MLRKDSKLSETPDGCKMAPESCILDITASGRYWRTSSLESVSLIGRGTKTVLISEKESDEYDMLVLLSALISGSDEALGYDEIITFNGNSFDLPHLHHKYAAYGLADPFCGKKFRDLFLEYRYLAPVLTLPSRKLADYAGRIEKDAGQMDDAEKTLLILRYDSLALLLAGNFDFISVSADEISEAVLFSMNIKIPWEGRISIHDGIYHLVLEGDTALLAAHLRDGKLRSYHTDTENYFYLPIEGYAVHKTIAEFVDAKRKEKAVRENCFHLITGYSSLENDRAACIRYINSALTYIGYH